MKGKLKSTQVKDPLDYEPVFDDLHSLRKKWIQTSLKRYNRTRPLRVLIGSNSLGCGGAEHQIMRLIPHLKSLGLEVEHMYYGKPHFLRDEFKKRGICSYFLDRDKMGQLRFWTEAVTIIRQRRYDVVHAFGQTANFYIRGVGALARVPVLFAGWRSRMMDTSLKWKVPVSFLNFVTSAWIVNAETNLEALNSLWWMKRLKIYVVPNGLEFSGSNPPNPKHLSETISKWVNGRFIVGAVGRIAPQKNYDLFLDVAKIVIKEFSNVCFCIIGASSGDKQTVALERHLRSRIEKENLSGFIKMLGRLDNKKVADFLTNMSILLCTSDCEGCPNAVLEGMRAGLPIIMTNCCDTNLLVSPGNNGYVLPTGDAKGMAKRTIKLLQNPEKRRSFGKHSREMVERYFNVENSAWQLAQIYVKEWSSKMEGKYQS